MSEREKELLVVIEKLTEALEKSAIALDDWLRTYADDECSPEHVAEARKRIGEYGTIGYIAFTQQRNRAALALAEGEKQG